jgi:hypothetical protein
MPVPHHIKRASRIKRRATPEVLAAYVSGKISAKRADILLHMNPREQALELDRRLSEAHRCEVRNALVASTIRKYLDGLHGEKVDLSYLSGIIRQALS